MSVRTSGVSANLNLCLLVFIFCCVRAISLLGSIRVLNDRSELFFIFKSQIPAGSLWRKIHRLCLRFLSGPCDELSVRILPYRAVHCYCRHKINKANTLSGNISIYLSIDASVIHPIYLCTVDLLDLDRYIEEEEIFIFSMSVFNLTFYDIPYFFLTKCAECCSLSTQRQYLLSSIHFMSKHLPSLKVNWFQVLITFTSAISAPSNQQDLCIISSFLIACVVLRCYRGGSHPQYHLKPTAVSGGNKAPVYPRVNHHCGGRMLSAQQSPACVTVPRRCASICWHARTLATRGQLCDPFNKAAASGFHVCAQSFVFVSSRMRDSTRSWGWRVADTWWCQAWICCFSRRVYYFDAIMLTCV